MVYPVSRDLGIAARACNVHVAQELSRPVAGRKAGNAEHAYVTGAVAGHAALAGAGAIQACVAGAGAVHAHVTDAAAVHAVAATAGTAHAGACGVGCTPEGTGLVCLREDAHANGIADEDRSED